MTGQAQDRFIRAAVLLEMADGTMVAMFTNRGGDLEVSARAVQEDTFPGTPHRVTRLSGVRHAFGLGDMIEYRVSTKVPEFVRGVLDGAAWEVRP